MGNTNFSEDFKRDAVHQIMVRGYPIREVSERLGVSTHSLYAWQKKYSPQADVKPDDGQASEIRRLKRELLRVTEERDILKKGEAVFRHWSEDNGRTRTSPKMQNEVRICC